MKIKFLILLMLSSCVTQEEINFCKAHGYDYAVYKINTNTLCTKNNIPLVEVAKQLEAADEK